MEIHVLMIFLIVFPFLLISFEPEIVTNLRRLEKQNSYPLFIRVETRSAPALLAATHRGFAFYVAHPIRSIHLGA